MSAFQTYTFHNMSSLCVTVKNPLSVEEDIIVTKDAPEDNVHNNETNAATEEAIKGLITALANVLQSSTASEADPVAVRANAPQTSADNEANPATALTNSPQPSADKEADPGAALAKAPQPSTDKEADPGAALAKAPQTSADNEADPAVALTKPPRLSVDKEADLVAALANLLQTSTDNEADLVAALANLPQTSTDNEAFTLSVSVSSSEPDEHCIADTVKVCTSYLLEDVEFKKTVIEITLESGYIPLAHLESIRADPRISEYDYQGNDVLFYISHLTKEELCIEFGIRTNLQADRTQSGIVKVYDYFSGHVFITKVIYLRVSFCSYI